MSAHEKTEAEKLSRSAMRQIRAALRAFSDPVYAPAAACRAAFGAKKEPRVAPRPRIRNYEVLLGVGQTRPPSSAKPHLSEEPEAPSQQTKGEREDDGCRTAAVLLSLAAAAFLWEMRQAPRAV